MTTDRLTCIGATPDLYYVKLNEDMISYSGDIVKMPHIEDYQGGTLVL